MDNLSYLFAAYTIIFAVIFAYAMFIWRRQVALEAELHAVEKRIEALGKVAGVVEGARVDARPGT